MSQVSGSLDEEDAEDITKGVVIQMSKIDPNRVRFNYRMTQSNWTRFNIE